LFVCIGLQCDRLADSVLGMLYGVLVRVNVRADEFTVLRCIALFCCHLEISPSQIG